MTSDPVRQTDIPLTQTSQDLTTWTTQPDWAFQSYSEGQSQILGDASWRLDWGTLAVEGTPAPVTIADVAVTIAGQFVRVKVRPAQNIIPNSTATCTSVLAP